MSPHSTEEVMSGDAVADSALTFGDLLDALRLVSESALLHSGLSRPSHVNCSMRNSVQRGALITNSFHIEDVLENIELTYMVSPPGTSESKMSKMKLEFNFLGGVDGSIDIWLYRPEKISGRPEGVYKFGLGVTEVQQGTPNPTIMSSPKEREISTRCNDWVEVELDGENLMGGMLQLVILAKYPRRGVLSVHLSATTYEVDPKTEASGNDMEEVVARRWHTRAYEREMLGGETVEDYLEH